MGKLRGKWACIWGESMLKYLLFLKNAGTRKIAWTASQERLRHRLEAGLEDERLVRLGAAGGKDPDG